MVRQQQQQQRRNKHQRHSALLSGFVLLASLSLAAGASVVLTGPKLYEGDPCKHETYVGKCVKTSECQTLKDYIKMEVLTVNEVPHCGFNVREEIICCPAKALDAASSMAPGGSSSSDVAGPEIVEKNGETTSTTTRAPILFFSDIFQTNVDFVNAEGGLNAALNPVLMSASNGDGDIAPATIKTARSSSTVPGCIESIGELFARNGEGFANRRRSSSSNSNSNGGRIRCRDVIDGAPSAVGDNLYVQDSRGNWQVNVKQVTDTVNVTPVRPIRPVRPVNSANPDRTSQHNRVDGNRNERNLAVFTTIQHDRTGSYDIQQGIIFNTTREYVQTHNHVFGWPSIATNTVVESSWPSVPRPSYGSDLAAEKVIFPQAPDEMEVNDLCAAERYSGTCLEKSKCRTFVGLLKDGTLVEKDIMQCALGIYEEIICCPEMLPKTTSTGTKTGQLPTATEASPTSTKQERPLKPQPEPEPQPQPQPTLAPTEQPTAYVDIMEKFPYAAAIGFPDDSFQGVDYRCAGILVSSQHVLVPENCAANGTYPDPNGIVFGTPNFEYFSDAVAIGEPTRHETKDEMTLHQLDSAIEEAAVHRPASIYKNYKQLPNDVSYSVTHWGRDENGFITGELTETPVQILPKSSCSSNYVNYLKQPVRDELKDAHICVSAGGNTNLCTTGVAACGSTLNMLMRDGTTRVLGITTPMRFCKPNGPMLFTALGPYQDFIDSIVRTPLAVNVDDDE